MKSAARAWAAGRRTRIPTDLGIHLVAATYGQDPDVVADWPADKLLRSMALLPATSTRFIPWGDE